MAQAKKEKKKEKRPSALKRDLQSEKEDLSIVIISLRSEQPFVL